MRIIDTYPQLLAHFPGVDPAFTLERWRAYAGEIHPALPGKLMEDSSAYSIEGQVLPVVRQALASPERMAKAHSAFLAAAEGLEERACSRLGAGIKCDIVFYLGLCNGAGWATELGGQPAVLLGLEKIIELGWESAKTLSGLLYHELGHLWHNQHGNGLQPTPKDCCRGMWQLYREGVATFIEQTLKDDYRTYHQDDDDWRQWCAEHHADLLEDFLAADEAGAKGFFGDWNSHKGRANIGYYLGGEFIKHLVFAKKWPLAQVAAMPASRVAGHLKEYATETGPAVKAGRPVAGTAETEAAHGQ